MSTARVQMLPDVPPYITAGVGGKGLWLPQGKVLLLGGTGWDFIFALYLLLSILLLLLFFFFCHCYFRQIFLISTPDSCFLCLPLELEMGVTGLFSGSAKLENTIRNHDSIAHTL